MNTRTLVVEDDEDIRRAVSAELRAASFTVDAVGTLAAAAGVLASTGGAHACAVFDRMLPDGDAAGFVDERRRLGWTVPVLFLTALDSSSARVEGFEHGGDDYLVKPFVMAELLARVTNLCRRGAGSPPVLRHSDLEVDFARCEVRRGGVLLSLSNREFAILEYLATRQGLTVSRAELIEHCWDLENEPVANVVEAVVKRLRRKLGEPDLVETVRGIGYRLS
ncbi:response regulator transcription factor [Amycolatopsis umgeniensis]|uniref:DNA-binding response OmpR family regulator n=1 Tax=Amycolatopsis umgeniensis TaxID=336628 RepID=A0A841AXN8_9PSEU|nr:response regulator transcription factor [Amycolatopsis umgeniensis]MBB5851280.1 DNA-binding response OmpR family regulator [Amycolatopsis umgeniensis]